VSATDIHAIQLEMGQSLYMDEERPKVWDVARAAQLRGAFAVGARVVGRGTLIRAAVLDERVDWLGESPVLASANVARPPDGSPGR
jgi:hypothetical protein